MKQGSFLWKLWYALLFAASLLFVSQPATLRFQNAELFTLTYGAVVAQLVKDYEDATEVNEQLDVMCEFSSCAAAVARVIHALNTGFAGDIT